MKRLVLWLAAALALASCGRPAEPEAEDRSARAQFPPDKHGELVYQGYRVFTQTPKAARIYTGNSLTCASCHLDAGRKAHAAPMWAAFAMYPAYLSKVDRVVTLEERIQQCFRFSMNGFSPPQDSHEMRALIAYMQWLAIDRPVGVEQPGRGFPTVPRTGSDPNPLRGKQIYAQRCASCHGGQGEGMGYQEIQGTYAVPPVWGFNSFNKGAGMHRADLLAGFLKANMPLGNADLSDQDALDVAAWMGLQERWPDPRKGLLPGLLAQ
ncbi:c-type cytochrome [Variovorax sp. J2P1-59]|uniref:c-type cytochrome n=1 Tax=Variovorax flavidus TaxID=3053501 RepID=UPI0025761779|nr:c-type cytochrome [Variovorax sp. J2P1-59]MDM0077516.1 c-type cytochrome [Variovorax sp. J2P1-59]